MGLLTLLRKLKGSNKEARILVLGLDNAGKTTILKKLSDEDPTNTTPTQGFNIKSLQQDGFKLNVWDIGGQKAIRPYWKNYYKNTDSLVFVVDSADKRRLKEAAEQLKAILVEEELAGVPLLVFANKQDLLSAMEAEEVFEGMLLSKISGRDVQINACSATTGDGLREGLEWCIKKFEARGGGK
eukprot:CAMPEP_0195516854 /NCGR_PEP_ID=MMETSP0794_2-20130614/8868_1 /TAXON_ID=515487 /ORGANISM="Stephanopyxis turris, Strain CCMP 815" /LENGTH=183 /DNA_ID=CAMNT_0040645555 /DNA_START=77 /DNA_END=628 /DNA_ORIENTATION=-